MSLYKVLDAEVEMDFLDADFVEKYENAYEKMEKDARNIDPTLKTSERIRKQCGGKEAVKERQFDSLWWILSLV